MRPVKPVLDPSKPVYGSLKAGDAVVLQLRDGRRVEITVARVEREALVSAEGVRYPHRDIAALQKPSFDLARTLGLLAGVYVGTVAVLWLAITVLWNS